MKIKQNHFGALRGTKQIERRNGRKYTIRDTRGRIFFPDEWMAFYDLLNKRQQVTFNTLINTGARIMEAQNIKISDIDFGRNNIILRVTKRVIKRRKKGAPSVRNMRVLPVSTQFIKYLRKTIRIFNLKEDDYLPILSTPAANIAMKKALFKAQIKDYDMFSLHNVRKTLETWLLALEVDSLKVIKHFGHSTMIALKHYLGSDIFSYEDKSEMRKIIGDLYAK